MRPHIHWYKTEFDGPTTIINGYQTFAVRKKVRKCRCGAMKVKIRGGW